MTLVPFPKHPSEDSAATEDSVDAPAGADAAPAPPDADTDVPTPSTPDDWAAVTPPSDKTSTTPPTSAERAPWEEEEEEAGGKMSFLEHLDELRRRLQISLIAIVIGMGVSLAFIDRIMRFIFEPLKAMIGPNGSLSAISPMEPFMTYLKVAALSGLVLAAPVVMWQVWLFIAPGLYSHEKRFAIPFVLLTTVCFVGGAAFSHYVLFPWAFNYFGSFGTDYLVFQPRIQETFTLYVKLMLALGLVFQIPSVVLILARMGVVTAGWLLRKTKYAILVIYIFAAVITPTGDPVTINLMAAPMLVLYLFSIGIAWAFGRRKPRPASVRARRR